MTVRAVEGKKPYTGGTAIEITEDKVINLRLRAENNLIIYDEGDDEIYVDLQLPDEITPTDAFPVGITTGRVIVDNGWDVQGTIICAKTTSGDNIKILYADDGKLYMDNGTGSFKQIYFKADVDLITSSLQEQIDVLSGLGKFLSLWDCASGEPMSFPLETPYTYSTGDYYLVGNVSSATPPVDYRPTGSEWDDVASQTAETEVVEIGDVYIYDGTVWLLQKNSASGGTGNVVGPNSAIDGHIAVFNGATGKIIRDGGPIPTGDVGVSTDTGTLLSAGVDLWLGTETDFSSISTPDTNTLYIQYKSDGGGGWQPGANTLAYYPLDSTNTVNDLSGNSKNLTNNNSVTFGDVSGVDCATFSGSNYLTRSESLFTGSSDFTVNFWYKRTGAYNGHNNIFSVGAPSTSASDSNYNFISWINESGSSSGHLMVGGWANDRDTSYSVPQNSWLNIVYTHNSGTINVYVNNNLEYTGNVSYGIQSGFTGVGCGFPSFKINAIIGNMSNLIVESAARTATEVANYFNQTKSTYGIS